MRNSPSLTWISCQSCCSRAGGETHHPVEDGEEVADGLGEFDHGEFAGVAEVDGAGDVVGAVHQAHEARAEIVNVAEGPGLDAVAVKGDGLVAQGLDDEVGDDAAIIRVHARAIGIQDAGDLDAQVVLTAVVEEQGLGAAFAFVGSGAGADGVDVAPVVLRLGMDGRITTDLAGGGLQDLGPHPLGQAEHVDGSVTGHVQARLDEARRRRDPIDCSGGK